MNRAVRKEQIRQILTDNAVRGRKSSTMTMVARRIGLQPSTHLMDILTDLWADDYIECDTKPNPRNKNAKVYWWYVIVNETQELLPSVKCSTPWDCPGDQSPDKCIIDGSICPEQIHQREK